MKIENERGMDLNTINRHLLDDYILGNQTQNCIPFMHLKFILIRKFQNARHGANDWKARAPYRTKAGA